MNTREEGFDTQVLVDAARSIAARAYAPYSNFRVGAAVAGAKALHTGANVENASYGLSLCAERAALAKSVAAGDREISAIAIACIDGSPEQDINEFMPCGACRQWLQELAPMAIVLVSVPFQDAALTFRLPELLPTPFKLGRQSM